MPQICTFLHHHVDFVFVCTHLKGVEGAFSNKMIQYAFLDADVAVEAGGHALKN